MPRFFRVLRIARDIAIVLVGILAAVAVLTHSPKARAEKFENKDTAVNRQDNSFGTRNTQGNVTFGHDENSETISSEPPAPKPERDYYDNMVITVNPTWPNDQTSTTTTSTTTGTGSTNSTSTTTTTSP